MVSGYMTESSDYKTNFIITAGGTNTSSSNYQSEYTINDILITNTSSSNYQTRRGWISTLFMDLVDPIAEAVSPVDEYNSTSSTVTLTYNITDTYPYRCWLYWNNVSVDDDVISSSGEYTFSYSSGQTSGSSTWYVSCSDRANNFDNTTSRTINFNVPAPPLGGGGGIVYPPLDFKFIYKNRFETSYIHRDNDIPSPYENVTFRVYLNNAKSNDLVLLHYGLNNTDVTLISVMLYDSNNSFTTTIYGHPINTLAYYFITAQRGSTLIRTPEQGEEVLVWGGIPSEYGDIQSENIIDRGNLWIKLIVLSILIVGIISVYIGRRIERRKKDKKKARARRWIPQ